MHQQRQAGGVLPASLQRHVAAQQESRLERIRPATLALAAAAAAAAAVAVAVAVAVLQASYGHGLCNAAPALGRRQPLLCGLIQGRMRSGVRGCSCTVVCACVEVSCPRSASMPASLLVCTAAGRPVWASAQRQRLPGGPATLQGSSRHAGQTQLAPKPTRTSACLLAPPAAVALPPRPISCRTMRSVRCLCGQAAPAGQ